MFSSFFFIPADNKRFIEKGIGLDASFLIFDLEESVCQNKVPFCLENLSTVNIKENYWTRIPLEFPLNEQHTSLVDHLYRIGFTRFMLPKLKSAESFAEVIKSHIRSGYGHLQYGILVETPELLLQIDSLLSNYREKIDCVLIGSHDYCNNIGCTHTETNLIYLRQKVLHTCKAYRIPVIDIVSQELENTGQFSRECIESFNMGFDGKSLIHPSQLAVFNRTDYYSEDEVREALTVYERLSRIEPDEFSIIRIQDKIYEHPHIKRIKDIVEWHQKRKKYDI